MKRLNIIFPRLLSNIVIRLLIAFILFLGVMLGLLTIGVVSDLLWKNIILAIVGLLTGICIAILYITIWQYRNANFVETSYLSLDYWIDKNDIGNASNLVKSLSTNKNIKEYFHKELDKVREKNKQNTKQFKITPKYELLVKAIPEIVDLIDKE
ncbi:TPA: ABC transporter ATP-binding protein, partial [Enterococcus faecalis OG1RF]|nr:ABC transporter ATP-binding protein [Enterococcus faecalis OG1RF]